MRLQTHSASGEGGRAPGRPHKVDCALFLVFVALLVKSASGELWLDEIWTLFLSEDARGISDLFFNLKHDNNHFLNTLWMSCVEGLGGRLPLAYRLLSLASGAVSFWAIYAIARRAGGPFEATIALVLTTFSYPMVLYFSEARGYGVMVCMVLLAYSALSRFLETGSKKALLAYWLVSIVGILAHSMAMISLGALALLGVTRLRPEAPRSFWRTVSRGILIQIPVGAFAVFWLWFFFSKMEVGFVATAKPDYVLAFGRYGAYLLGFPATLLGCLGSLAAMALLLLAGSAPLFRREKGAIAFWIAVTVGMPVLSIAIGRPDFLFFRYFIAGAPFFYVIVAAAVAELWQKERRWIGGALVLLLVAGNLPRLFDLVTAGRGNYVALLNDILERDDREIIRIATTHESTGELVLGYHLSFSRQPERFHLNRKYFVKNEADALDDPMADADWVVLVKPKGDAQPLPAWALAGEGEWSLEKAYRAAEESGWETLLYRRAPVRPPPIAQEGADTAG